MTGTTLANGILLSLVAAIVPTILYVLLVRWLDRYEREPAWLLGAAFVWGAVPAIIGSLVLELIVGLPLNALFNGLTYEVAQASAIAPIVEESLKALGLLGLLLLFRAEFDDTLDGVVYGALIGFGFAMTENFFYYLNAFSDGGAAHLAQLIFLRAGVFGFTHAFFTGVFGAGLGYARGGAAGVKGWSAPILALGAAMGFHALHNFGAAITSQVVAGILLSLFNIAAGVLILIGIVLWALAQERRWIAEELRDEINVSLTSGEYELLTRKRAVLARKTGPLACIGGKRVSLLVELARVTTELAFRKRRVRAGDASAENLDAIAKLRDQIGALRRAAVPLAR